MQRRSLEFWEEAQKLIPGGSQLLSRRPSRFAFGVTPIFAERAEGACFWDVDGNRYLDTTMSVGAVLLGYCDPEVAVEAKLGNNLRTVSDEHHAE